MNDFILFYFEMNNRLLASSMIQYHIQKGSLGFITLSRLGLFHSCFPKISSRISSGPISNQISGHLIHPYSSHSHTHPTDNHHHDHSHEDINEPGGYPFGIKVK